MIRWRRFLEVKLVSDGGWGGGMIDVPLEDDHGVDGQSKLVDLYNLPSAQDWLGKTERTYLIPQRRRFQSPDEVLILPNQSPRIQPLCHHIPRSWER